MYFSDKIILRKTATTSDAEGYPLEIYTDNIVWANFKSVARTEFYSANANGINASIMFVVHVEDWGNQTVIIHNNKQYNVIRSYQKGAGTVEITCSDKAV